MQSSFRFSLLPFVLCCLFVLSTLFSIADTGEKISEPGVYKGYSEARYKGFKFTSLYVPSEDRIPLATDVYLPKGLEKSAKVPTILYLTRYVRSLEARWFVRWLKDPVFGQISENEVRFFTSHGYAVVIVDVRGTGASGGVRAMEFSPEEVKDGATIVDWIITQPWSNGAVGSTGISYLGTTAEMLLVNGHPAVKACVPRSNIFDLYNDITFPGGVRHGRFVEVWRNTTYALDNNDLGFFSKQAKRLVKGIHPVDADKRRRMLNAHVELHKQNFDIFENLPSVQFRDELHPQLGRSLDDFSIHTYRKEIERSQTPIYRISGWYDGGLANSSLKGFLATSNSQKVMIGPWDHGPAEHVSPFAESNKLQFDVLTEILRFFDFHLKGVQNGIDREKPIAYFNMGQEKWGYSEVWPVPVDSAKARWFLSVDQKLMPEAGSVIPGKIEYDPVADLGTGGGSRWNSLTGKYRYGPICYPDRAEINKKMLVFTSSVFEQGMDITGHPIVNLNLIADGDDASVFVYLEDVAPDGTVCYITEGQFRALHRTPSTEEPPYPVFSQHHSFKIKDAKPLQPGEPFVLNFELQPISWHLQKGHRIRLSISCADLDHFDLFDENPAKLTAICGGTAPSSVFIPFAIAEKSGLGSLY